MENVETNQRAVFDMDSLLPGETIISKHGMELIYVGKIDCPDNVFIHQVKYPDGGWGTRSKEGWTFVNKPLPEDHDIVAVKSKI